MSPMGAGTLTFDPRANPRWQGWPPVPPSPMRVDVGRPVLLLVKSSTTSLVRQIVASVGFGGAKVRAKSGFL